MFNNSNKTKETPSKSTAAAGNDTYTRIGEGVTIEGNINCQGDVRVDGNVSGNIVTSARIIIGTKGKVLGDLRCNSAEIDGKVNGKIHTSNLLSVTENANIEGDVVTGRLSISDPKGFNVSSCKLERNASSSPKKA